MAFLTLEDARITPVLFCMGALPWGIYLVNICQMAQVLGHFRPPSPIRGGMVVSWLVRSSLK